MSATGTAAPTAPRLCACRAARSTGAAVDRDSYEVRIALSEEDRKILAGVSGLPLVGRYKAGDKTLSLVLDPDAGRADDE